MHESQISYLSLIAALTMCCACRVSLKAQFFEVQDSLEVVMTVTGQSIFGHAVSIHDFDGDGLDDISFGTTSQNPRFYRNTGEGFELYNSGIESPNNTVKSLLWVDLDNDGDKDLFISYENSSVRLYENTGDMNLVDITEESGLAIEYGIRNSGAAFGDFDNDGFLDLYLCKYHNSSMFSEIQFQNMLYRNNGDLSFTDVTSESNASVGVNASFMATWLDYNEDGWQDIFVVNDRLTDPNHLLRNNGDGTFTDIAPELGMNAYIDAMGCSPGDFNNDLHLDFFVANSQLLGNHLYKHLPNHEYENIGPSAGVEAFDLCWSGLWMDYDNNGFEDLHVGVELHITDLVPKNLFYRNNGDETFSEIAAEANLGNDDASTWATAQGDWNMDGYPDFVSHNKTPHQSLLWENQGGENHYLAIRLEGSISNRDAVGSLIYCYAGDLQQMRYVACGENYLGQNSQRKLFGLSEHLTVDSLVVKWLSGHTDRYYNLQADTTYHFLEGSGIEAGIHANQVNICPGQIATITALDGENHTWSNGVTGSNQIEVEEPGTYSYTTVNEFGVTISSPVIEIFPAPLPQLDFEIVHPLCAGDSSGQIFISTEGDPETLTLTMNDLPVGWSVENLPTGDYAFLVSDSLNCISNIEVSLGSPQPLTVVATIQGINCFGETGSAFLEVSGGSGEIATDWGSSDPDVLTQGEHSYTVSDGNGCVTTGSIALSEPPPLEVYFNTINVQEGQDGSIESNVSGGTPPYNYMWTGPDGYTFTGDHADGLAEGVYTVVISDSNGCTIIESVTVIANGIIEYAAHCEAKVYPNPVREFLKIEMQNVRPFTCKLYHINGQLVRQNEGQPNCESHVIFTRDLHAGSYLLVIEKSTCQQRQMILIE